MRHRPVKDLHNKIKALGHLLLVPEFSSKPPLRWDTRQEGDPSVPPGTASHPGRWYEREAQRYIIPEQFKDSQVYVEFGCGKGDFINALSQTPDALKKGALMVGIEGGGSIILAAMRKTDEAGFSNVRYINSYVNDAAKAFAPDSLDGLFLNFSDPWPKDRHADRRLTAPSKAAAYHSVLKPGGFAVMKTDGKALYEYSLETIRAAGFSMLYQTTDLGSGLPEDLSPEIPEMALNGVMTQTEYERRFRGLGYPIYCFIAIRKA